MKNQEQRVLHFVNFPNYNISGDRYEKNICLILMELIDILVP